MVSSDLVQCRAGLSMQKNMGFRHVGRPAQRRGPKHKKTGVDLLLATRQYEHILIAFIHKSLVPRVDHYPGEIGTWSTTHQTVFIIKHPCLRSLEPLLSMAIRADRSQGNFHALGFEVFAQPGQGAVPFPALPSPRQRGTDDTGLGLVWQAMRQLPCAPCSEPEAKLSQPRRQECNREDWYRAAAPMKVPRPFHQPGVP
ncbi:hypothetical protein V2G26_008559 [Clonostachys chloroleuca]